MRLNGTRWWCWSCDREVAARARPAPTLARTRLAPKAPVAKRARVRASHYGSDPFLAWLHGLPCCAAGLGSHVCGPWDMDLGRAPTQAVHVRARGAGGRAADQVPGCWVMHQASGELGTSDRAAFEHDTGLDLVQRAAEIWAQWCEIAALNTGAKCANVTE